MKSTNVCVCPNDQTMLLDGNCLKVPPTNPCTGSLVNSDTGTCTNVCTTGYYRESSICRECDTTCSSCTNGNTCLACATGFDRNLATNLCYCAKYMYIDPLGV